MVFVSGDEATCKEVSDLVGDTVVTAAVKKGLGRFAARNLSPSDARRMIEDGVYAALSKGTWPPPYDAGSPATFRVELASIDRAESFRGRTGVEITGPRTVVAQGQNFWECWDRFWYRN